MKVQFYLPGGGSVYVAFSWETTVAQVKEDIYAKVLSHYVCLVEAIELDFIGTVLIRRRKILLMVLV
jgi:hypothetical protein